MAFADNTIQTFQDKYNDAVLPALAESSTFSIPLAIARLEQTNSGENVVFYNIGASVATNTLDGAQNESNGTIGDMVKYEATIEPAYIGRRVYKTEMNKTSLNIAGDFVKAFVRGCDRKINLEFLGKIDTAKAGTEIGDVLKSPSDQIDEYIEACELASIRVSDRPDYAPKAILLMNEKDYANLYRAAKKTSVDFGQYNSADMFYGCTVKTFGADVLPSGKSYVIPYGTTGFGYWEEVEASSTYESLFDGMWCWAKKSGGTVVIEPGAIEAIVSLPSA